MLLRKKTQIIISLPFIFLIVTLYAMSRVIFLDRFAELEKQDTRQSVEQVLGTLSSELSTLDATASDWASRQDTSEFVQTPTEPFPLKTMADELLAGLRLNLIVLIDSNGETVWGKGFDLQTGRETPIPPSLQSHLQPDTPLLAPPGLQTSLSGLLVLPQSPMLVAARPILTGEAGGSIQGRLILGRYLDTAETRRLVQGTRLSLSAYPLDAPDMPADVAQAQPSLLETDEIQVRSVSASKIVGYALVKDIYEQPALILQISQPREIYTQGQISLLYFLALSAVSLVFGGTIMLALERTVLSRLARLSNNVSQIGAESDLTARVNLSGDDELGSLASEINKTLAALEQSQNELSESEQRFRSIVEQSVDGIIVTDESGRIIEWNQGQESITGLEREEVLGQKLAEVQCQLIPQERQSPALHQQIQANMDEFLECGQAAWMNQLQEQAIQHADGSQRVVQTLAFPIKTDKGWMSGSISRDVTERKRAQQQLSNRLEEQETLFAIGQLVSSSLQIEQVTQKVAEHMARLVSADSCAIFDWHPETNRLTLRADYTSANNHLDDVPDAPSLLPVTDQSSAAKAIHTGQPFTVYRDDPEADPQERRLLQARRGTGVAGIPIVAQDRLIGLAKVYLADGADPFSEHDLRLLQALANQVAVAIDNARLFATVQANEAALRDLSLRLINVQEQERRQIAQELHDELGQLLTAIKINIDLARRKLPETQNSLQSRLADASSQTDRVLTNVRGLTVELRPPLLDDMGVVPTLRWYLRRFAQRTDVQVELEAQELPARLLPEIETAIYRSVQEALTNVARHAQANQVQVRLSLTDDQVVTSVQDDGQGFDVTTWSQRQGKQQTLGLRGIEERAMLLDGQVHITSQPGQGTRIDILLPARFSPEKER